MKWSLSANHSHLALLIASLWHIPVAQDRCHVVGPWGYLDIRSRRYGRRVHSRMRTKVVQRCTATMNLYSSNQGRVQSARHGCDLVSIHLSGTMSQSSTSRHVQSRDTSSHHLGPMWIWIANVTLRSRIGPLITFNSPCATPSLRSKDSDNGQ
ncbi:hypothetical protein F4782DRAFT_504832 [Xylaria castorea]|nr:hypothetical protein F4782DRAFT_504832 [Xylaria castorea]